MTRWKAAGSHLALSILVIGGIALTAFLLWYPHGLHKVAGLDRILLVMLGIDLTAGPLLTLILYKPGKRGLKFDLTVVAIAQLAFLGYGLNTLWQSRPVFLVATPDMYTVVFANEIDPDDLAAAARPEWRRLSWTGPVLVGARMPEDPDKHREVMEAFMAGGAGIERTPRFYLDFDDIASDLIESAGKADVPGTVPVASKRGAGDMRIDSAGRPLGVARRD